MKFEKEKNIISRDLESINERQIAILDQDSTNGESWDYYCNGQITNATVSRNRISGIVRELGAEFHIEITVSENEISSHCSCGLKESVCKHVIALLYSWVNDREDFVNISTLIKRLQNMEKHEFIDIFERIFEDNPANARFIASPDDEENGFDDEIFPN